LRTEQPTRHGLPPSLPVLRDAVVAGRGIALQSDYPLAATGIHTVMPQRRLGPPQVHTFVDFLAGRLGDDPPRER
jgi:DNA-binding transcriptional LysR family regulator